MLLLINPAEETQQSFYQRASNAFSNTHPHTPRWTVGVELHFTFFSAQPSRTKLIIPDIISVSPRLALLSSSLLYPISDTEREVSVCPCWILASLFKLLDLYVWSQRCPHMLEFVLFPWFEVAELCLWVISHISVSPTPDLIIDWDTI